jgi:glutathione S-transferase
LKLHWSPRSPFVRKVMIVLHEAGLLQRVELVRSVAAMTTPNAALMRDNPLSKIPALVLDDDSTLIDSRVICEYLDGLRTHGSLHPLAGDARWEALSRQALGDGMLDALVLWRNELNRSAGTQEPLLLNAFAAKIAATLARLEREAPRFALLPFDIGHVAIGCALSYADFRFATLDWRRGHPQLAAWHTGFEARPSAVRTRPDDDGQ